MTETDNRENAGLSAIFGILDLSSPLQQIYRAVLRNGDVSVSELSETVPAETPEELKIYLDLLARLGYLEKYIEENETRFRVKGKARQTKTLSDDIWKKLES